MKSPLGEALHARVRLLATKLRPSTVRQYEYTVRRFLMYLHRCFPAVRRPDQLLRDPHMLGWLEHLWTHRIRHSSQPLKAITRASDLIRLRKLLELLSDHDHPPRAGLLLGEDIPRLDQVLPRPLTPEDDARLQAELRRRQDLLSSALLLTRLCGARIGETVDLREDCLRHLGGDQWALHIPVGKLHNERWTPVDEQARSLVMRLRFLRTLPPTATDGYLLPRPKGRGVLCSQLRAALCQAVSAAGISVHIVPHQLRHTYATTMLRAGVSMPALMKLLGHRTANMTLRYVEITQKDLQREMQLAWKTPRYLIPLPAPLSPSDVDDCAAPAILARLSHLIRIMDLYRQHDATHQVQLLLRRLLRIRALFQKLTSGGKHEK